MAVAIGMDIGGTKIEASLINECGEIQRTIREPALSENGPMLDRIAGMATSLSAGHDVLGYGFSIPGSIDAQGILRNAPNSPAIQASSLPADLATRISGKLLFENDANCLAISERAFGAARGYKHVVGIILGTGVGGGVIIDGKTLHGWRGLAPEPGHMPLDIHGRLCLCGNRGCAEAYLSGPSLLRRYHDQGGHSAVLDTQELFQRPGDPLAAAVIQETAELYARFVAALISLYDPEVFVLGGGLSLQPLFYQQTELIGRYSFGTDKVPPILKAERGDASGKLGAAALIFNELVTDS